MTYPKRFCFDEMMGKRIELTGRDCKWYGDVVDMSSTTFKLENTSISRKEKDIFKPPEVVKSKYCYVHEGAVCYYNEI